MYFTNTRTLRRALIAAAGTLAVTAPVAGASSVTAFKTGENACGDLIRWQLVGGPGEVNNVRVASVAEQYPSRQRCNGDPFATPNVSLFTDSVVVSSPNCPAANRAVLCTGLQVELVLIALEDGDDSADVAAAITPAAIFGGDGNDRIVAASNFNDDIIGCGSGVDTVIADLRDQVDPDCENVTRTPF